MIVYPEGSFYAMVKEEDIPEIVEEHLLKGRVVTRLLYEETVKNEKVLPLQETQFYKKQHRVALRNCGVINRRISRNISVRADMRRSEKFLPDEAGGCDPGPSGRTSRTWRSRFPHRSEMEICGSKRGRSKYVCCNADEGDPVAFHGSFRTGRRSSCRTGSNGDRRIRYRRVPGIYLCPCRVSNRGGTSEYRDRSGQRIWIAGKRYF